MYRVHKNSYVWKEKEKKSSNTAKKKKKKVRKKIRVKKKKKICVFQFQNVVDKMCYELNKASYFTNRTVYKMKWE